MSRYLTVIDDERATLKLEFHLGLAFVHLVLKRPMQGMRDAKVIFPQIKSWLKRMGHDVVYVIIPQGDDKLYRFGTLFGFREKQRRRGQILMIQEC